MQPEGTIIRQLSISYELDGTGWAHCTVDDGAARCTVNASYLSDALGTLVLAGLGVLSGFSALTFAFDEEPGEYRWIIRSPERNTMELCLLAFDERRGNPADSDGRLLLATRCRPAVFARAVHAAAQAVLERHGEAGYQERWAQHAFPSRQLYLLGQALDLPENCA